MSSLTPIPFRVLMTDLVGSSSSSKDWVRSIKDELKQSVAEWDSTSRPVCRMFTVDPDLRNVNPEHYSPQEISLGLFHRSPLTAQKSRADKCRFGMARKFLSVVGMDVENDWEKLCQEVVPDPRTQDLYEEVGRTPLSLGEVQSVLTLDAIFLACYFGVLSTEEYDNAGQGRYYRALGALSTKDYFVAFMGEMALIGRYTRDAIMRDILKVENQIPLYLIERTLSILFRSAPHHDGAVKVLLSICFYVARFLESELPGFNEELISDEPYNEVVVSNIVTNADNLLDCGYRWLLRKNKHHPGNWNWKESLSSLNEYISLPSVTKLHQAGIKFRGREGGFDDIEFRKGIFSAILYLPTFNMGDNTKAIWRNLLAFEEMQRYRVLKDDKEYCDFGCYMHFMYNLINDEKDIILLRKGKNPVIRGKMGSNDTMAQWLDNKTMAQMFHGDLIQNCMTHLTPSWILVKMDIHDYYNKVPRKFYLEFIETYFSKPWLIISILGASIVVTTLLLQTLFIILLYYSPSN